MDWTTIGSALVVVVVLYLFLQLLSKRSVASSSKVTMLAGISNAGKTTLYHRLKQGTWMTTVTSMKEKSDTFALSYDESIEVSIVDFPGHPRLRLQAQDFFPITKAIIFLIDASDKAAIAPSAEYLFDIFTHIQIQEKDLPLLIACNKFDMKGAMDVDQVKLGLAKELTQLKNTRASLETEGEESENAIPLGRSGQAFDFAIDCPCDISFATCSVKKDQLEPIVDFFNN